MWFLLAMHEVHLRSLQQVLERFAPYDGRFELRHPGVRAALVQTESRTGSCHPAARTVRGGPGWQIRDQSPNAEPAAANPR